MAGAYALHAILCRCHAGVLPCTCFERFCTRSEQFFISTRVFCFLSKNLAENLKTENPLAKKLNIRELVGFSTVEENDTTWKKCKILGSISKLLCFPRPWKIQPTPGYSIFRTRIFRFQTFSEVFRKKTKTLVWMKNAQSACRNAQHACRAKHLHACRIKHMQATCTRAGQQLLQWTAIWLLFEIVRCHFPRPWGKWHRTISSRSDASDCCSRRWVDYKVAVGCVFRLS